MSSYILSPGLQHIYVNIRNLNEIQGLKIIKEEILLNLKYILFFLLTELWMVTYHSTYMNDDPNAYKQMFQFYSKLLSNKCMENCGEISYFSVMENLLCDLYDVIEDVTNVLWNLDKWFFPFRLETNKKKYICLWVGVVVMIDVISSFYLIFRISKQIKFNFNFPLNNLYIEGKKTNHV